MATQAQWRDYADEEFARKFVEAPRLLVVHRPLIVHDRVTEPGTTVCDCGCGSTRARVVERKPHLTVLFDRVAGTRKVRHRVADQEAFDRLAATATPIHMPLRVYPKQRRIVGDKRSKIVCVFGGNRSGKSQVGVEWMVDQWLLRGGRGATFWWVSPQRKQTRIAVDKLCTGFFTDRFNPPVIDPRLITYFPKNELTGDQSIRLLDGSRIELKYASRQGGHLKGATAQAIVLDEGTEVRHEINWTILVNRLMDSKGQLLTCTTPVAGHWLERYSREAVGYDDIANCPSYPTTVKESLSCFDNPWCDPEETRVTIEALGGPDDPRVKREVYGEWVANGRLLWRHYEPRRHNVEMARREPELYGWVNLTPTLASEVWIGMTDAKRIEMVGGLDYNCEDMAAVIVRILCREGDDQRNPNNWHLYVDDEVILPRAKSAHHFAEFLRDEAHTWRGRGLPKGYFGGLHIVSDGTGFFRGQRGAAPNLKPDAIQMASHGFVMRAPEYKSGKPNNPPRRARIAFMNELLYKNRLMVNAARCPRLIESLQTELDDGSGDTLKRSDTVADRKSGVTDALGYVAYAMLYRAERMDAAREIKKVVTW